MRKRNNNNRKFRKILMVILPLLFGFSVAILFFKKPNFELAFPTLMPSDLNFINNIEPISQLKLSHKIKTSETLASILTNYGFEPGAINNTVEKYVLKSGSVIDLKINKEGEISKIKIPVDKLQNLLIKKDSNGQFVSELKQINFDKKEKISIGQIESSFAAATSRAGISYEVVDELVDIFSDKISFQRDFRKGDRFVVIYNDNITEEGTSLGNISILAALIEVKGNPLVAVRFVGEDGKARYFDQKSELLQATFLRYPLKYSRISSGFSSARLHPVLNVKRPHLGVDFAAPIGTPVRTVADGNVIFAGRNGGAGIMVKIQHNTKIATAYLHLSKIEKGIKKNVKVQKGQIIGAVGKTGLATGAHLHFSFYDGGKAINPLKMIELPMFELADAKQKINDTYLRRVLFTLDHYRNVALDKFYASQ